MGEIISMPDRPRVLAFSYQRYRLARVVMAYYVDRHEDEEGKLREREIFEIEHVNVQPLGLERNDELAKWFDGYFTDISRDWAKTSRSVVDHTSHKHHLLVGFLALKGFETYFIPVTRRVDFCLTPNKFIARFGEKKILEPHITLIPTNDRNSNGAKTVDKSLCDAANIAMNALYAWYSAKGSQITPPVQLTDQNRRGKEKAKPIEITIDDEALMAAEEV